MAGLHPIMIITILCLRILIHVLEEVHGPILVLLDLKGLHNARMNQTHALSSLCREIFAFASHVVGVCDLIKELRVALLMTCVLLDLKSDSIGTVLLANGVFLVRKPILIIGPVWHVCSLHILPLFLIH